MKDESDKKEIKKKTERWHFPAQEHLGIPAMNIGASNIEEAQKKYSEVLKSNNPKKDD